jgi:hypothetical protein
VPEVTLEPARDLLADASDAVLSEDDELPERPVASVARPCEALEMVRPAVGTPRPVSGGKLAYLERACAESKLSTLDHVRRLMKHALATLLSPFPVLAVNQYVNTLTGDSCSALAFWQHEMAVATSELPADNRAHGVGVFNDFGPTASNNGVGFSLTADGANTWTDSGLLPTLSGFLNCCDGRVESHRSGVFLASFLTPRSDGSFVVAVARSLNNGSTWIVQDASPVATPEADFPDIAVDNSGGSCDGYIYACWADFVSGGQRIRLSRSTDGGTGWTQQALTGIANVQLSTVAVGIDGRVHVAWKHNGSNEIKHRWSGNCGSSWNPAVSQNARTVAQTASPPVASCGYPALYGLRTEPTPVLATDRVSANKVYIAYETGTPYTTNSVFVAKSVDSGSTWASALISPGYTEEMMPSISTSKVFNQQTGQFNSFVYVHWQRIATPSPLAIDTYGRLSTDGAGTWQDITRVSAASSPVPQPLPVSNCYFGDYIGGGVASGGGFIRAFHDTRNVTCGAPDPNIAEDTGC